MTTCRVVRQDKACGKTATCRLVFGDGDVQSACAGLCDLHTSKSQNHTERA
jgi:hypothetical protein